jgi:hypothetical protein
VPPHLWQGPEAFKAWSAALESDSKTRGATDQVVTLGAPSRVETNGQDAYIVVPAVFAFKERGVAMRETAQMTFVLKKDAGGWLIHAWTWTGPRPKAAAAARPKPR